MTRGDLTARVEVLEENVGALEELPAQVASLEVQVLQLRAEMRGEFSAVRQDMRALEERLGTQMRVLHEEVIDRIARLDGGLGPARRRRHRR